MKKQPITWKPKRVLVSKIKPTEKNYKIKTDLGKARLQQSLKMFGLAGTVIVNTDMMLIDGNSRLEEAIAKKEKFLWVSMPSRKLSPSEFKEMSAMYDFAKASEVDHEAIDSDLGTSEDFFNRWNKQIPMSMREKLGNMGKGAKIVSVEAGEESKKEIKAPILDVRKVELFFTSKQEEEFRKIEDKLADRLKTVSTTDTVLKVMRLYVKGKKI